MNGQQTATKIYMNDNQGHTHTPICPMSTKMLIVYGNCQQLPKFPSKGGPKTPFSVVNTVLSGYKYMYTHIN